MRKLGMGACCLIGVVASGGCGGGGSMDAGVDTGVTLVDGGRDAGMGVDSGPRDGGMMGGRCGPTGGACDLTTPTSCGSGMACLLTSDGMMGATTSCFPAGTGGDGTACDPTMAGQCAEGFGCSQGERVCRRWCCSTSDCNPPGMPTGQVCGLFGDTGPPGREAGMCSAGDECTLPPPQMGCDPGEACNNFMLGLTVCDPEGMATEGQECMFRNSCVAGYACVSTGAGKPGRCRQYCDMAAMMPCPDMFRCSGLMGAPDGIGVCVPAM